MLGADIYKITKNRSPK